MNQKKEKKTDEKQTNKESKKIMPNKNNEKAAKAENLLDLREGVHGVSSRFLPKPFVPRQFVTRLRHFVPNPMDDSYPTNATFLKQS